MMLEGARDEGLLAVDLYNQPRQPRRLEGFLVHMHIAWVYLLQAEFTRDGIDYRYRLPNNRFERIDGEPKTWDLKKCVSERWPDERRTLEKLGRSGSVIVREQSRPVASSGLLKPSSIWPSTVIGHVGPTSGVSRSKSSTDRTGQPSTTRTTKTRPRSYK